MTESDKASINDRIEVTDMDSTVKANDDKLHANASVSATVASKGSKRAKN